MHEPEWQLCGSSMKSIRQIFYQHCNFILWCVQVHPPGWKPKPAEQPEFANEPPKLEEAFQSVTDTDPWERARTLMQEQGLSMQEVGLPPGSAQ